MISEPSLKEDIHHWQTNLAPCLIFVVTLEAIGLERGASMN
jgi:hypothetical protein